MWLPGVDGRFMRVPWLVLMCVVLSVACTSENASDVGSLTVVNDSDERIAGAGEIAAARQRAAQLPIPPQEVFYTDFGVVRDAPATCSGSEMLVGETYQLNAQGFAPGSEVNIAFNEAPYPAAPIVIANAAGTIIVSATAPATTNFEELRFSALGVDSRGTTRLATAPILYSLAQAPLCALPDTATTQLSQPVTLDVLANDTTGGLLDPSSITVDQLTTVGTLEADTVAGTVTFTAADGFIGRVTSSYGICDSLDQCRSGELTIDVTAGCTIMGTPGDDVLIGTVGDDVICGGTGNDIIDAGEGDDTVFAGDGDDFVYGGAGDDTIYGGDGSDTLTGNSGSDFVDGGAGSDTVDASDVADTIALDPLDNMVVPP